MIQKIYILAIILLSSIATFGQTPGWDWAVRAGASSSEAVPEDIVSDASGNVYVTGNFGAYAYFGNILLTSEAGSNDFFLAKYDPSGNVLWATHGAGKIWDGAHSLTIDDDGNIYVTGTFESDSISFDNITLHNSSPWYDINWYDIYDMFVVKYDASGTALWAKSVGGSDWEAGHSVAVDDKGNVYVAGTTSSTTISFDSLSVAATLGFFLVKYDSLGNRLSVKIPNEGSVEPGIVITDSDNNLYLSGTFIGTTLTIDTTTLFSAQYPDAGITTFIIKYDSAGNVLWKRSSGGDGYTTCSAATSDGSGNIYLTGSYSSFFSSTFDTITLPHSEQFFIVKYDASGNVLWAKGDGGLPSSGVALGQCTADGHAIYISGYLEDTTITFGNILLTNPDLDWKLNIFFAKYDYSGNLVEARIIRVRGDYFEQPSLTPDSSGHIYMAGYFSTPSIVFGNTILDNYSYMTLFLAKLNDTLSCSAGFALYPDTLIPHHYWGINNATGVAPLSYYWSWGDGTYDSIQFPSHTYASAGFYNICLTTEDAMGCSDNYCYSYNLQKLSATEKVNTIITVNVVDSIPGIPTNIQNTNVLQSWSVFPNPASGNSFIHYTLSTPATVIIDLYDVLGNKLLQLANAEQEAGEHNSAFDAGNLANGIYLLQIRAGDQMASQKIVILQ